MGKVDGVVTKVSDLEAKVETFGKKPVEDKQEDDKKTEEKSTENGVTSEQFSALTQSINGLVAKVDGMETKFNKLSVEVDGQEPNPAGLGESYSVV
jgi:outer membrane murein-binding lipoprotein Lpp